MDTDGLQYKENLTIISGGYPGEELGSTGLVQNWTDISSMSGSSTVTYYYRDSQNSDNANSSRVDVTITETWEAVKNSNRSFTITAHSKIDSITRGHINGTPGSAGAVRKIVIKDSRNGAVKWSVESDDIRTAHTIATNIDLGTNTFTLNPDGGAVDRSAIYLKSGYPPHFDDPVPNTYVDEFWIGIGFRNILPPDYRPMMVRDSSGVWQSCDRAKGMLKIRKSDGSWKELRTVDGPNGTGNPPYIFRQDGVWHNQRRIGHE